MNPKLPFLTTLLALAVIAAASADTLELKNGKTLTGQFSGGDASMVKFQTADGMMMVEVGQAVALKFAPAAPAPVAAAPSPVAASAPAPVTTGVVTVPAGTLLLIRLDSPISSDSASAGQRFSCKLETDLVANGVVAARAGTTVYGRVTKAAKAGRLAGKSEIQLQLSEMNIGGQTVPLVTGNYTQAGQGEFRNTARNAAVGAGIGAAVDGGEGAGKGAAIGGAVSLLKKGEATGLNAGSLLEFRLTSGMQINVK